jgi:hypothetical protein
MYQYQERISYTGNVKYAGAALGHLCSPIQERYDSGYKAVSNFESVYSWRGKVNKNEAHSFTRQKFHIGDVDPAIWTCTHGAQYVDGSHTWCHWFGCHPWLSPLGPWGLSVLSNTDTERLNYLDQELYAKANEPKFDAAVFLAELGETVAYVTLNVKHAFELLMRTKEKVRSFRHARNRKSIQGAWLEYRYAVLPLMLDIENIISLFEPEQPRDKVNVGYKEKPIVGFNSFTASFDNWGVPKPQQYHFKRRTTTSFRGGAGFRYGLKVDHSPFGTSLVDAVRAGWETVPLSFIADWFLGVGSWLTSLRGVHYDSYCGYATVVQEVKVEYWLDGTTNCNIIAAPSAADPFTCYAYRMTRRPSSGPPLLPVLNPLKLKWFRQLDAAALIIGAFLALKGRRTNN